MKITRYLVKDETVQRIPCYATYVGSVVLGDDVYYQEQVAVLAVLRADTQEEANERLLWGEEPEVLMPFARNPLSRWALKGQKPIQMQVFEDHKDIIPLEDIEKMQFLEGSLEII